MEKVTSCVFGGANLDELYITSARIGLDEVAMEAQPFAGGVFKVDAGVSGLPVVPYAGITS